jgi:N-acetylglucosamine malate deacetylase 1
VMGYSRVLVISPHTDDAELGAGGTLARLIDEGKEIYYVGFSCCEKSLPQGMPKDTLRNECFNSLKAIGIPSDRVVLLNYQVRTFPEQRQNILDDLIKFKEYYNPDLVLTPSSQDVHQDHGTIYWEVVRAFKKKSSIWGYEHPWNNLSFTTDIFFKLESAHLERKIKALQEYKSQSNRSYMAERNIRSLAYTRGAQLDIEYAETFELIRMIC